MTNRTCSVSLVGLAIQRVVIAWDGIQNRYRGNYLGKKIEGGRNK
jgi:hypothetical protein